MRAAQDSNSRPVDFATTRWTVVLAAGDGPTPEAAAALSTLCESYWYPLYAYARRRGQDAATSEDLVQSFFTRILEANYLDRADPARGRFRTFLLTAFQRFLINDYRKSTTERNGGGQFILSLNVGEAEVRLAREPIDRWTPEKAYAREWALSLLDRVLLALQNEYVERDKGALFALLQPFLSGQEPADYQQLSQESSLTTGALRVTIHRMRQRYGELLRAEIRNTVDGEHDLDGEMRALWEALAS